jgi:hypothetical protein
MAKKSQTQKTAIEMAFDSQSLLSAMDVATSSQKALQLGFVNLGDDRLPIQDKEYPVIPASSAEMEDKPVPQTNFKRLNFDLICFYNDNLPDFLGGNKEGLFKVSVNTRDPQNLTNAENDITMATDFVVKDQQYAPGFLHKGVYRNVIFNEWINLRFDLYELDTDAGVYLDKVNAVINGVPEIKNLNVLNGIPYLSLATKLFEGIVRTFGKNPDDHIWGEIPILEITPTIGGAFLRSGIYVIFQSRNKKDEQVSVDKFFYKNNQLFIRGTNLKRLSNHLLFSIALQPHQTTT